MQASPRNRALLVDDHSLVRSGVRRMIESLASHIDIVGESNDGREALRLIEILDIDLLITDLSMPGMDGIGLIRAARKRKPDIQCVALSMHTERQYVAAAIKAGACAYLPKNADADELLHALNAAINGRHYLHPSIAGSVMELLLESGSLADPVDVLSDRQREILKLLAEGHSVREIAELLSVSIKTVETHRSQLMQKLNIRQLPGLVKFAIKHGIVEL